MFSVTHSHRFCSVESGLRVLLAGRPGCFVWLLAPGAGLPQEGTVGEAIVLARCCSSLLQPKVCSKKRGSRLCVLYAKPPSLPTSPPQWHTALSKPFPLIRFFLPREADPSPLSCILQRHSRQNEGRQAGVGTLLKSTSLSSDFL